MSTQPFTRPLCADVLPTASHLVPLICSGPGHEQVLPGSHLTMTASSSPPPHHCHDCHDCLGQDGQDALQPAQGSTVRSFRSFRSFALGVLHQTVGFICCVSFPQLLGAPVFSLHFYGNRLVVYEPHESTRVPHTTPLPTGTARGASLCLCRLCGSRLRPKHLSFAKESPSAPRQALETARAIAYPNTGDPRAGGQ